MGYKSVTVSQLDENLVNKLVSFLSILTLWVLNTVLIWDETYEQP